MEAEATTAASSTQCSRRIHTEMARTATIPWTAGTPRMGNTAGSPTDMKMMTTTTMTTMTAASVSKTKTARSAEKKRAERKTGTCAGNQGGKKDRDVRRKP